MNIEALEKLAALKEKGIISDAEFEIQKQKLLNDTPQPTAVYTAPINKVNKGINWANWFISLLFALVYTVLSGILADAMEISDEHLPSFFGIINIITSIPLTIYALKVKIAKYKGITFCRQPGSIWIAMLFLGPIALGRLLYQFLQIKQGNAVLEDSGYLEKRNGNDRGEHEYFG